MTLFPQRSHPASRQRGQLKPKASRKPARRHSTVECLETRTLLSYTFTGGGTNAGVATGDGSADTLYLEPFGGLIYHSTDGIVFSPDWGGGLTIAASTANSISVFQGNSANAHAVRLGGVLGPISSLQATFNINDGGPLDSLVVDDSQDTQQAVGANAYTIAAASVTGPPTTKVSILGPALGEGLTLLGGTADNTFNVNSTFSGEPVAWMGTSAMTRSTLRRRAARWHQCWCGRQHIQPEPYSPEPVQPRRHHCGWRAGGTNHVVLNDQNGAGGTYTVDGSTVSAPGFGGLTYGTIADLTLNSSNVGSTINVSGTSADTVLNTGTGDDTTNVFATGDNTLDINGQAGTDIVDLSNSGSAQGLNGTINVGNAPAQRRSPSTTRPTPPANRSPWTTPSSPAVWSTLRS